MKAIFRNADNKANFLIDRSSKTIPECVRDRYMYRENCGCVEICIDDSGKKEIPFFCPQSGSFFAHDPYVRWEPYHIGDDPDADFKIKEIADYWGIKL